MLEFIIQCEEFLTGHSTVLHGCFGIEIRKNPNEPKDSKFSKNQLV